jgi:hypothetical protein
VSQAFIYIYNAFYFDLFQFLIEIYFFRYLKNFKVEKIKYRVENREMKGQTMICSWGLTTFFIYLLSVHCSTESA